MVHGEYCGSVLVDGGGTPRSLRFLRVCGLLVLSYEGLSMSLRNGRAGGASGGRSAASRRASGSSDRRRRGVLLVRMAASALGKVSLAARDHIS